MNNKNTKNDVVLLLEVFSGVTNHLNSNQTIDEYSRGERRRKSEPLLPPQNEVDRGRGYSADRASFVAIERTKTYKYHGHICSCPI